jgi:hypothetical protein
LRSLRQILIVALTAVAAVTAGRMLRDFVDDLNASPTSSPSIVVPAISPSTTASP